MKKLLLLCSTAILFITACSSNQITIRKDDMTNKTYLTYERTGSTADWATRYEFNFVREIDAKADISYIDAKLYCSMKAAALKDDAILKCGQTMLNVKISGIQNSVHNWQSTSQDVKNDDVYEYGQKVGTMQTTTTTVENNQAKMYTFQIPVTPEIKKAFSSNPDAILRFYTGINPVTIPFNQSEVQKISQLLTQSPAEIEKAAAPSSGGYGVKIK